MYNPPRHHEAMQVLLDTYNTFSLTTDIIRSHEGLFVVKAEFRAKDLNKETGTFLDSVIITSMASSDNIATAEDLAYERVLKMVFPCEKLLWGSETDKKEIFKEYYGEDHEGFPTPIVPESELPPAFAFGVPGAVISSENPKEAESRFAIAKQEGGGIAPSTDKIPDPDDSSTTKSFSPTTIRVTEDDLNKEPSFNSGFKSIMESTEETLHQLANQNHPIEEPPIAVPLTDDSLGDLVAEPIPVTEAMPEKKTKKRSQPKEPVEAIAETPEVHEQIIQPSLELTPQPPSVITAETLQIDFSEVIARTNKELKRLNWTNEQGKNYLLQTYGKRSRQLLSDEELLEFVEYLESLPTPDQAS